MKTVKAFCIKEDGYLLNETVRCKRSYCIKIICDALGEPWKVCMDNGYKVVQVEIKEVSDD